MEDESVILEQFKGKWINEQEELKKQLIEVDLFDWQIPTEPATPPLTDKQKKKQKGGKKEDVTEDLQSLTINDNAQSESSTQNNNNASTNKKLQYIGGMDISFVKDDPNRAVAGLVVLEWPTLKIVYSHFEWVTLTLPYISGFLAFREVPHLVRLVDRLRTEKPELLPQVLFIDGNGVLHPRGFGVASHLGVLTDIPTVGVGKTYLVVDGLTVDRVKAIEKNLTKAGDAAMLVGDSGKTWGALLRATPDAVKPVYVSTGHRISLESAIELTKAVSLFRVPEPIRQADLLSRQYVRDHLTD